MRKIKFVFAVVIAVLAVACNNSSSIDRYKVLVYIPQHASGFEILGADGMASSIVVTKTPWRGADSAAVTRLFVQRGDEAVPDGFDGQVLRGEARSIVCMSSSYVAMLDAIGEVDRAVGVSGIDYVSNPAVQARRDSVADIGYDGNVDYERLLALDPDIVLLFGVNGASGMEGKLRELGIPFMYIGEYLEESPLGKAEWLVAVAEIVGKRAEGQATFAEIPERYNALKEKVAEVKDLPKVMINTPYADSWVMASTGSYVAQLISDAGGKYVYTKNETNQSLPIDMEEAYLLVSEADVWLNVGQISSMTELTHSFPKFADTKPVQTKQVWNSNLRVTPMGGNDYWESGVVHPDRVLQDLIMIFHPDLVREPFTYYKRLE